MASSNGEVPSMNGHSASKESHPRQFTGTFAPAVLHDLVESGGLHPVAAWLALVIASLSKGKRGCFASNAFLGKKIHKSEPQIRVLLRKLEAVNLLGSRWEGRTRFLWINWDQDSQERRKTSYLQRDRLKTIDTPIRNNRSDRLEIIDRVFKVEESKESTNRRPGTGDVESSGFDSFSKECAAALWEAVRSKKPEEVNGRSSQKRWQLEFSKLRKSAADSEEEVLRLLKVHITNWDRDYWPEAFSARSFRLKYSQIKAAETRLKKVPACPYKTVKYGDRVFALVPNCDGFEEVPLEELGRRSRNSGRYSESID